ncbi:Various polyols ABC transporter, permease component 2, partial [uncultured Rubrobacteraceae bacterium]
DRIFLDPRHGQADRTLRHLVPGAALDARPDTFDGPLLVQARRGPALADAGPVFQAYAAALHGPLHRRQPRGVFRKQRARGRHLDVHRGGPRLSRRVRAREEPLQGQAARGVLDHLYPHGPHSRHRPAAVHPIPLHQPARLHPWPDRGLPHFQPAVRDLDHERLLPGPATLPGGGRYGRRRLEVPGVLPGCPTAGNTRHRDDGHSLPGLLLERLRLRRHLRRPQQPDPPHSGRPTQHPDRAELGSALGRRHRRRAPHDGRRPGRQALPGKGTHSRRGHRRV